MTDRLFKNAVVVLGATSRIAMDFVATAAPHGVRFRLHARRPGATAAFLADNGLPAEWNCGTLEDVFATAGPVSGILNCVGIGDPAKARDMGAGIFDATLHSDTVAMALLDAHPEACYVFLSSGAVYGTGFSAPAGPETLACVPVNDLTPTSFYTIAKLHAESVHRSRPDRRIVDLRIFNYVSRTLDPDARFIITDMVRAIRNGKVFETVEDELVRDYLGPEDLRDLLLVCLATPPGFNGPVDAYSRAPINKSALISLMTKNFGLRHRWVAGGRDLNATGVKPHYYSTFREAGRLGFSPTLTSASAVTAEVTALLAGVTKFVQAADRLSLT